MDSFIRIPILTRTLLPISTPLLTTRALHPLNTILRAMMERWRRTTLWGPRLPLPVRISMAAQFRPKPQTVQRTDLALPPMDCTMVPRCLTRLYRRLCCLHLHRAEIHTDNRMRMQMQAGILTARALVAAAVERGREEACRSTLISM